MRWGRESIWSESGRIAWLEEGSREGDAPLMSAAPDLYAALADVLDLIDNDDEANDPSTHLYHAVFAGYEALKKASGEAVA